MENIDAGEVIGEYRGRYMTATEYEELIVICQRFKAEPKYIFKCSNSDVTEAVFVDGSPMAGGNLMGQINHYYNSKKGVTEQAVPNTMFVELVDLVERRPKVVVVATIAIARGSELLIDYGPTYLM